MQGRTVFVICPPPFHRAQRGRHHRAGAWADWERGCHEELGTEGANTTSFTTACSSFRDGAPGRCMPAADVIRYKTYTLFGLASACRRKKRQVMGKRIRDGFLVNYVRKAGQQPQGAG